MIKITHPVLGEVAFAGESDARWETRIEMPGRSIRLDINIDATAGGNPQLLDNVSQFISDPVKFDRLARAAMQDNEEVRFYMDHTLDRSMCRNIDVWLRLTRCFGIDDVSAVSLDRLTMDIDQFLSKIYLKRIGLYPQELIECAIFDYRMGDGEQITQYLIVVKFDRFGEIREITIES
jgi:Protein of unknown function (DUF2004)